jgi:hypothetical protein
MEVAMRSILSLFIFAAMTAAVPGYAQLVPGGGSGDFRVNDRPGTAPTVGPPGGPSLPADSSMFRDTSAKPPDEILKSIDKDLGRSTVEPLSPSAPSSFDASRELQSTSDKFK